MSDEPLLAYEVVCDRCGERVAYCVNPFSDIVRCSDCLQLINRDEVE